MRQICTVTLIALWLGGCTSPREASSPGMPRVSEAAPSSSISRVDVRIAREIDLAPYKALAVVMPEYMKSRPDALARVRALGVFDQVISSKDLPSFVMKQGLQRQVSDLGKWSGYQVLFHAYKPFLVVRFDCAARSDGVRYSLIVTNPGTLENIYVGDVEVMSRSSLEIRGLLTLGAGLHESNCFGAVDHGAVDALFASMTRWLHDNIRSQ